MKYKGTFRRVQMRDNKQFYDLAVYAILKSDGLQHSLYFSNPGIF